MVEAKLSQRPSFVVSTGRCGSKMLARVLALHPEIRACHEPRPWLNTEAYLRWSGRKDSEYAHARLGQKRDDLVRQIDANGLHYVESSHFLSHLIPELRDRYDARFVHLYRDGRDFVRSGLEREWYRGGALAPVWGAVRRTTGLEVGDSFVDHRLDPPPRYDSRFERIAWLWAEINGEILDHLESVPDEDRTELRLEAFGADTIRELLGWLGHPAEDRLVGEMAMMGAKKPNRTEDREIPPPEEWTEARTRGFYEIAGDMMHRLGYGRG